MQDAPTYTNIIFKPFSNFAAPDVWMEAAQCFGFDSTDSTEVPNHFCPVGAPGKTDGMGFMAPLPQLRFEQLAAGSSTWHQANARPEDIALD